ncbi:MAG: RluA family pseudouridine synthase [Lautropia sp.]
MLLAGDEDGDEGDESDQRDGGTAADTAADGGPDASSGARAAAGIRRIAAAGAAGVRLDQFVAARLDGVSRTRVQRWIGLGAVRVDGALRLASHRLTGHERIEVEPQPLDSEQSFRPDPIALAIVARDADLLVVDKPAGLVTHPAPGHWRGTLMNGLLHADPASARLPRAGIVHRLDRDTSGLLVCARSERAFVSLTAQLAARTMGRAYLAVVEGAIAAAGTVDAPIGRDPRQRLRMAVVEPPHGKPARTHYRVIARSSDGRFAALLCRLDSGRTHQIRVHLASIGHPLVGDTTYGGRPHAGFERQALHAWRLTLQHPASGSVQSFDAPLPADLRSLADALSLAVPAAPPAESP